MWRKPYGLEFNRDGALIRSSMQYSLECWGTLQRRGNDDFSFSMVEFVP